MMRIKFLLMFLTLIPLRRSLSVGEPPPPPQPLDSYVSRQLKLNLAVYLYWDPYVRVDPGKRFSYHTKKGWQNSVLGFLAAAQPRHLQREVLAEVRRLVVGEKMLGGSVSECEGDGGRRAAKGRLLGLQLHTRPLVHRHRVVVYGAGHRHRVTEPTRYYRFGRS